jgi:hypothetical protein
MKLINTIIRIVNEEVYSPSSKKYEPGKYVAHKSNPMWRDDIKKMGLQTSVGDCYNNLLVTKLLVKKPYLQQTQKTKRRCLIQPMMMTFGL